MLVFMTSLPALAEDPVEALFAARGPLATEVDLSTGPGNDFSLFRPAEPGASGAKHPVITWGNGTFAVPLFYFDLLDHLASHGFVVIASNDAFTGSGEQMLDGVDWILAENEDPESVLHQAIDIDAIGATGHSQGGAGAIRAGEDPRIGCTAPIEPVPAPVAGLNGPMFVIAGQNDFIVPAVFVVFGVYVPSPVASVLGILKGATHFDALGDGSGFRGNLTAWFAACLAQDATALTAFIGPCTLCSNPEWIVARKPPLKKDETAQAQR